MANKYSNKQAKTIAPISSAGGSNDSIFSRSLEKLDHFGSSNSLPKSTEETEEGGINVVVRVRPLNGKEIKTNDPNVISFPGNGQILVEGLNIYTGGNGPKSKLFSFNVVFEPGATQNDVFNFCGIKKLINMALEGYNTTCFCYGQTGSGKTHTLTGPPGLFFKKKVDPYSAQHGLIFRAFLHLFQLLQEKAEVHFVLKASFLEIYNEKVIDLLNPSTTRKPLSVRWSKKSRGFFVENLFTVDCEELDDLQAVLEEGMRNRSIGQHNMNSYSGRSHTILTVHITSEQQMADSEVFITKHGKINFVDLAGSEMTKKTNSTGKTLEEANNINKSLMVLGYCIASLSDPRKRNGHIPYRDSKLTKLLADSLAGSGVTLMIACVSPTLSNLSETMNTLRYAARAKKIRTKPIVVMDPRETLILALKREVEALENENERLRMALDLNKSYVEGLKKKSGSLAERLKTPPQINLEKLAQMKSSELVDLIKHYAVENEALRKENADLFHSRDLLMRDHQLVCRENERLLKKVESDNMSPILLTRTSHSAEAGLNLDDLDMQKNNSNTKSSSGSSRYSSDTTYTTKEIPDAIQKEMNKKQIGKAISNLMDSIKTRKSASGKKLYDESEPSKRYMTSQTRGLKAN
ncbi:kinesin-like protein KIF12 isoform X2 [Planococcus citri]|uniref:kinesin-like protein KIF12 isoform X2 n=1 Tax=Planococcus citri TaxID=170843 RepID=UPI0031F8691A